MILLCSHCQKKHTIDPSRIPPNITLVRCKYCKKLFPFTTSTSQPQPKEARRIAVTLSKGGVGKTTTAVNLAHGLALTGKRILLIDTDTQGQSAFMLGVSPKAGLTELITGELPAEEAFFQARENLWLLSGGKSLAGVKRMIQRKDFGGEHTLSEKLSPVANQFDYIIFDTSPGWDPIIVNVLFFVKEIIIPVSLEVMTLQGLAQFLKSFSAIQKYNKKLGLKYLIPTFHDNRIRNTATILNKLKELYGDHVSHPIHYNVKLCEAPAYGQSIFEFAPNSKGAEDYQRLVELIDS
jgi:chromosome partitioning protein